MKADEISRTAKQVRIAGGVPHKLAGRSFNRADGHSYRTRCKVTLKASNGAVLTTHDPKCGYCLRGERAPWST